MLKWQIVPLESPQKAPLQKSTPLFFVCASIMPDKYFGLEMNVDT